MFCTSRFLVYPDGETQEVDYPLQFNDLVDINGRSLRVPLPTHRMIAYRVTKIRKQENKGEDVYNYHLELVPADELRTMVRQ